MKLSVKNTMTGCAWYSHAVHETLIMNTIINEASHKDLDYIHGLI